MLFPADPYLKVMSFDDMVNQEVQEQVSFHLIETLDPDSEL